MLFVGLGNPGKKYDQTRHNLGFMFIDSAAKELDVQFKKSRRFKAEVGEFVYNGAKHYFLKPLTYMNLSGEAVRPFMDSKKIKLDDLVVISDDLDLPVGKIRIRKKSASGGHNGIKSIIACLGTDNFKRIRIGIDKCSSDETIDYVLSGFSTNEQEAINSTLDKASDIVKDYLDNDFDFIMNKYNWCYGYYWIYKKREKI